MTEYRMALPQEEADILDFINYVFSQAHRPHNFKTLLPKVYAHEGFSAYHYVAVTDGHIRGTVAVLPVDMSVGDGETLKIGYVGSVSVHPYDRGAGHMKQLMQLMLTAAQDKYDLLVLGGQRQRYQYFGFEKGSSKLSFTVTSKNVRHALAATSDEQLQLREITSPDDAALDSVHAMVEKKMFVCKRTREQLLDVMHSWQGKCYVLEELGTVQGYLYVKDDHCIAEMGLPDESRVGEVLKTYMKATGAQRITVCVNVLNRTRANYLKSFAEKWELDDSEMLHVINWQRVLTLLLSAKADCQPLMDGRFVFEVENAGCYAVTVKEHAVHVCETQDVPQMVLTQQKAVEFFFSPYTAFMASSPLLKSWLPVPFGLYPADEF